MRARPASSDRRGTKIRVLVCDELPIMRDGVRTLLDAEPDIEVVDTTDSGIHAMILIRTLEPAVVLMGMTLRSLPALEVVRRVAAEPLPTQPRFVVLGAPDDSIDEVLRARVNGVLLRDVTREELSAAVRTAARGHMALCPQVAQSLVDFFRASRHGIERGGVESRPAPAADLTAREREVLQLVAQGLSAEEVAERLTIGVATARTHLYRLRCKLELRDRAQLVSFAYREGLVRSA